MTTWMILRWPLVMAITSITGLIAALVGDGVYDLISWAALGSMVIIMLAGWRGWFADSGSSSLKQILRGDLQ